MSGVIFDPNAPSTASGSGVPIRLVPAKDWAELAGGLPQPAQAAATLASFAGKSGELVLVPGEMGGLESVLFGLGRSPDETMVFRGLSARLPPGDYRLVFPDQPEPAWPPGRLESIALAWALGAYRFERYKRVPAAAPARLAAPAGVDTPRVLAMAAAIALARDMINTPANDMGPARIEAIVRDLAEAHGAVISVTVGDDLIEAGYPAVHAVGRAAVTTRAPRMIEMTWAPERSDSNLPLVAVIGKGVVFDTGGLDMKPSSAMRLMKKDMGGAAHAVGLAQMIMDLELPIRLVLLIPAVENAIAGDAMRPGDVLASRKGLTIEVGNTDAEGRLILADALARAAELDPDLTVDLATLTGAARAALGPQVIPFYTADDSLAEDLAAASTANEDPLWRMPLWDGYDSALDSDIADIKNDPDGWAQAGSVTAALFLRRFAPERRWAHFDIYAWNPRTRPGWPAGAEAQAIRAIMAVLETRYR
jgi:leucyl aminopeptidase